MENKITNLKMVLKYRIKNIIKPLFNAKTN